MQFNSIDFKVLTGNLEKVQKALPLAPFSDDVLAFLNALSRKLMSEKMHSDIVTLGFWIRQASLINEKTKYDDINSRLGRGIAFHIAPSNVAINFAFSLVAGLLAGNANIIRLPSKDFPQVNIIISAINQLLEESHANILPYICIVKYPVNKEISDKLSSICDVRIIWGGDKTIADLRSSALPPRAYDITFADRYSAAAINADEYLLIENKNKIATDFFNDTYLNDQNACTSPSIIFWMGNKISEAKSIFWNNINKLVKEKYQLSAVQAIGKLSALYGASANVSVSSANKFDNFITCVEINEIPENLMDYKYNSGFFFEYNIDNLSEILPVCNNKFQTLTYFGLKQKDIESFFAEYKPQGIDRVVPMGSSMDFSLVWDGHDLIREMSRKITIV